MVAEEFAGVLAIRRDNGQWAPGGELELEETLEEGVRREVMEETGLEVDVLSLSGVYKSMSRGVIALVFKCRPLSGSIGASEESLEVEWISYLR